jgi:hypothetical protein
MALLASISLNWMASVMVAGAKPWRLVVVSAVMVFLDVCFQGGNDELGHGFNECLGPFFCDLGALRCLDGVEQRNDSCVVSRRDGWVFYIHDSSFTVKLDWRTL